MPNYTIAITLRDKNFCNGCRLLDRQMNGYNSCLVTCEQLHSRHGDITRGDECPLDPVKINPATTEVTHDQAGGIVEIK